MNLPDADEILLGELLAGAQDFQMVCGALAASDFARPEHQMIWKAMVDLYNSGECIDRVNVANRLMMECQLDACGGLSYLVRLDDYPRV